MEIVILVKQVPDPEAIVRVKSDTELEIENKYFTSFFDEIAVEAGLKLKERCGGRVTVVTVDNRRVDALRRGIAMGADEAIQIADPALEGADSFAVARALAAFLKEKPLDVVLAGRQAMDDDAGIVGPAVAELLGIPHVSAVVSIEPDPSGREARMARDVENGREQLSCPFPCLITCQKGLCIPRIPLVMNVMKAMRAQIKKVDLAGLGLSAGDVAPSNGAVKILRYLPPPKRPPVRMIKEDFPENVKTLVRLLREEAKVL
jgi:electron transfer flavoprotein beta subunit